MEEAKTITIKKRDLWKISTFILLAVLIGFIIMSFSGSFITGKTVSEKKVGQAMLDFALSQGIDAKLVSVEKEGGFYLVVLSIEGNQIPVYVTRDGKYFTSSLISLTETSTTTSTTNTAQQGYSSEDLEKLREFNECLAAKGVRIYGTNWCGYTVQWVTALGGFDTASPIYIECTEEQELCQSEGIQGYPTTKINGQAYSGARTIEAIAQETGCSIPDLTGAQATSSSASASC